jgi:PAS domain S-box-containing protein
MKPGDEDFYRSLMLHSPVATAFLDESGCVITVNAAFEKLFEYPLAEAEGRNIDALVADDAAMHDEASAYTRRILERGETIRALGMRRTRSGSCLEVEMQGVPVVAGDALQGVLVTYTDVGDRLDAQRNARNVYNSFSTILDSVDADIYVADMTTYEIPWSSARTASVRTADRRDHPRGLTSGEALVTASAGVALYPGDAATAEELIGRADTAMYTAKRAGKNAATMASDGPGPPSPTS